MSILHFSRRIGKFPSWAADGKGTVKSTGQFEVEITDGKVEKGYDYEIQQGQQPLDGKYHCTTGAVKGGKAEFQKQQAELQLADPNYLGAEAALRAALAASEKTVTIQIALDDLKFLKASNYRLCFAKKVSQGDYNVVWQSYTQYLANNSFSWTPQYQLFGSNVFQANILVKVSTNLVRIGLGEESVLDEAGVLNPPTTGGPATSVNLVNDFGSIHPGLNQLSIGLDGKQVSTPIYVAPVPVATGTASLTPVEKVLVWFEQNIETSTMFSDARTRQIEIDLTFENNATRLYQDGKWSTPGG